MRAGWIDRITLVDDHWIWDTPNSNGYGPHRAVYAEMQGSIPAGLDLDHTCRVRSCVAPHHLEPVTRSVNLLRGERAQRTHCPRGHCRADHRRPGRSDCAACHRDDERRRRNTIKEEA